MIAKYFRFLDEEGQPMDWIGLAVAKDKKELFWTIDQHGDPYQCEIKSVDSYASICVLMNEKRTAIEEGEGMEIARTHEQGWQTTFWFVDDQDAIDNLYGGKQ